MNVKLITRAMPWGDGYVVASDAESKRELWRSYGAQDLILARASAIELATSRGWHIVSKDWDR